MASSDLVQIEIAQPIHREGLITLAERGFNANEPIDQSLGTTWVEAKEEWKKMVDLCLENPHSHVALNSSGEVVGFRLSRIINKKTYALDSIYEWTSGDLKQILDRVARKWRQASGKSEKSLQFMALCVRPDYGGRGIAMKMCEKNLELAKQLGCDSCTVVASNWMSQRVFEKGGFRAIETVLFTEFRKENGEYLLPIKDPKQTSIMFFAKDL